LEPKLEPQVADEAPCSDTITDYDLAHLVTYLRLLDAMRDGAGWDEACRAILRRDPDQPATRRCWDTHLKRAEWMTQSGYRRLLDLSAP
jgi:hypothetical protein